MSQLSGQTIHDEINQKLDLLASSQSQILALLKGQPLNPHDSGILGDVHSINIRVQKIESQLTRAKWVAVGLCLPASYGIVGIIRELILKNQ